MNGLKVVFGLAAVAALGYAGLWAISPRITEREAALKIVRGALVDAHVGEGVKMDDILPHVSYVKLPKFMQRMAVRATSSDNVAIRTKEKAQVFGTFEIHFRIDNKDKNFGNIYTELKCDDITDLEPFIKNYAIPAAIDVYRGIETSEVNDNLTKVGKDIAIKLQDTLNQNGFTYIQILDVIPSGVGLSPKANADLEAIVSEERKLDLLRVQSQVASNAVQVTQAQSAVTAKALEELRKAGIPEDQLIQAYYLQLLRDNDKIGTPNVPGPIPGTGVGSVPSPR